ncbi:MAG: hypothetical protein P8R42_12545 [Candidatus Binatia bacterium]|nr:hypothetical protein [Candidatus Binatia bacterium]
MAALAQMKTGSPSATSPILLDTSPKAAACIRQCRENDVDVDRLQETLESAFRRSVPLRSAASCERWVFLAGDYLGAAVVTSTPHGSYLAKLAVKHDAQSRGLAAGLWRSVIRVHPDLFWRSRADNPVCEWYGRLADGSAQTGRWTVFWRGLPSGAIPGATEYASSLLRDFE